MKIVYVITRSDVIGGANIHLLDLAVGMQDAGHEVTVLIGGEGEVSQKFRQQGLQVISLKHLVRPIKPWQDLQALLELRRVLKRLKPDLVHAHSSKAGILGRLAAKSVGLPVIFTVHGWAFTEGVSGSTKKRFYQILERTLGAYTDHIITVSDYDRELGLKCHIIAPQNITTVHNGIHDLAPSDKASSAINQRVDDEDSSVKLIMVARFDQQKNQALALQVLASLKQLPWHLCFIGDGPTLDKVKQQAQAVGLAPQVTFAGRCDDVAQRLARADVFVLTTNWEGLPISILEAMRAGLPIMASDVGGIREQITTGQQGFLLDNNDLNGMQRYFQEMICDERLRHRMGVQARLKFEQAFSFEQMLHKTLGIYELVLRARTQPNNH
ncbi:glycosyltransferase family 4 protein [Brackiella oedipodis]|uniref:glycosyltransferase family 4 protein n=1 Tax=Brackiella oedipodis TaxID=124225 RepID=UPI00056ECB76|nr:glycosyltransferase family 4 protein [Brackiella oedipodis]